MVDVRSKWYREVQLWPSSWQWLECFDLEPGEYLFATQADYDPKHWQDYEIELTLGRRCLFNLRAMRNEPFALFGVDPIAGHNSGDFP